MWGTAEDCAAFVPKLLGRARSNPFYEYGSHVKRFSLVFSRFIAWTGGPRSYLLLPARTERAVFPCCLGPFASVVQPSMAGHRQRYRHRARRCYGRQGVPFFGSWV